MAKHKKRKLNNIRSDKHPTYKEIVRENENFVKYYKAQRICPEEDWDKMLLALRCDLPTGFRITSYPKFEAEALLSIVESTFFNDLLITKEDLETEENKPICLSWYPQRLGWQIQITRNDIRKSEIYFRLHNFLISETEGGNINRQEVVSMIPPILLDVQSHHKVLDLCAAPGSKTAQLIEQLHATSSNEVPKGVVVANDIDNKRCYMLVHQAKRLNSPCAIVTNHDAAVMPNILINDEVLKFDRVLCDVPCSGDGTLRKNPDIWTKWNAANGNNLHGVQIRILKRGLEMLNIGGRLVYSTCSLNPIENEAVIYRLLVDAKDSVKLLDVSNMLPGLKFCHGLTFWLPASKDIAFYKKFEDVPEKFRTVVRPQMFPPDCENIFQYELHKCIRILPHHQDTGGFFVAVLEKIKSLPWELQNDKFIDEPNEISDNVLKEPVHEQSKKRLKKHINLGYKEDPFVFFQNNEHVWKFIRDFYDLPDNNILPTCLFTRCNKGKKKNIYFCSPIVKQILTYNRDKIKIINSGVRLFVRCDKNSMNCNFRLTQEGILNIYSYFGNKRIIETNEKTLIKILKHYESTNPLSITELDEETLKRVEEISMGSCIIQLKNNRLPIKVVGWRGNSSLRAYIAVSDCVHYLRILGEDVSMFDKNKFKKQENTSN